MFGVSETLLGELTAGDALWNEPHPLFTARLQMTVALSWTETDTVIELKEIYLRLWNNNKYYL